MLEAEPGDGSDFLGGLREDDGVGQHRVVGGFVAAVVGAHGFAHGDAIAEAGAQRVEHGRGNRLADDMGGRGWMVHGVSRGAAV